MPELQGTVIKLGGIDMIISSNDFKAVHRLKKPEHSRAPARVIACFINCRTVEEMIISQEFKRQESR